jgi:hypothetical protein
MIEVRTDKTAFDQPFDPISSQGMMRHAISTEDLMEDILNGYQAFDRQLFTAASELTIAAGVLAAPTLAMHTVAAESGGIDELDTIGASDGSFVVLKAKSGHLISLRNGTGNIHSNGVETRLFGNVMAMLWCQDGEWGLVGMNRPLTSFSSLVDPTGYDDAIDGYSVGSRWINLTLDRAWYCVDPTVNGAIWKLISSPKNRFMIRNSTVADANVGVAVSYVSGGPSLVTDADGPWSRFTTAASAGDAQGLSTTGFNAVRPAYSPIFEQVVKTDSDITLQRLWVGLSDNLPTNVDTLVAGREFIGFRYSTVAGDTGWKPVLNDGSTQNTGTNMGTVAADTAYRLRFQATNFPPAATDMGVVNEIFTTTNAVRRLYVGQNEVMW